MLQEPEIIAKEIVRKQGAVDDDSVGLQHERRQYEQQLELCTRDLQKWEAAYLGDVISLEDFRATKGEIDARRLGTQDALERIARQVQVLAQAGEIIQSLETYCRQV